MAKIDYKSKLVKFFPDQKIKINPCIYWQTAIVDSYFSRAAVIHSCGGSK